MRQGANREIQILFCSLKTMTFFYHMNVAYIRFVSENDNVTFSRSFSVSVQ